VYSVKRVVKLSVYAPCLSKEIGELKLTREGIAPFKLP